MRRFSIYAKPNLEPDGIDMTVYRPPARKHFKKAPRTKQERLAAMKPIDRAKERFIQAITPVTENEAICPLCQQSTGCMITQGDFHGCISCAIKRKRA